MVKKTPETLMQFIRAGQLPPWYKIMHDCRCKADRDMSKFSGFGVGVVYSIQDLNGKWQDGKTCPQCSIENDELIYKGEISKVAWRLFQAKELKKQEMKK